MPWRVRLLGLIVSFCLHGMLSQDADVQIILPNGDSIPADEGVAMNKLLDWMDALHWTGAWESGSAQRDARTELERLAGITPQAPWLALGLGQVFLLYYWWKDDSLEVDIEAAKLSSTLHYLSIRSAGCDEPALPAEAFKALQCTWRWRHSLMIPTELGVYLAHRRKDVARSAALLREAQHIFRMMQRLPYFSRPEWSSPNDINTNAEFFPGAVNRPVWPSKGLPFAEFLEANVDVFRTDLDSMITSGQFDHLYWTGEVSLTQFSARHEGWAMLSLFKNQKLVPRVCAHANASCALLAERPEIAACSAGDAGAAFARLLPGQGLRPHFWNAPRLGAHLGLRTPPGATMWVGGKAVTWEEGKATIFDDTYTHSVLHEGSEPRYVLIAWLCHPCDSERSSVHPAVPEPLCAA